MVVLEAAVLLEAGWDSSVHEVWTTFVPRDEVSFPPIVSYLDVLSIFFP